jgi:hypothetical protein
VVAVIVGHSHHHNNGISIQEAGGASGATSPLGAPPHASDFAPISTGRTYDPNNLAALVPSLLTAPGAAISPTAPTTLAQGGIDGPSANALAPPTNTDTTTHSAAGTSPTTGSGSGVVAGGSGGTATTSHGSSAKPGKHHRQAQKTLPAAAPSLGTPKFSSAAAIPTTLQRYQNSSTLLQCAATVTTDSNARLLAVDFGRWSDATNNRHRVPALILVFSDPTDTSDAVVEVVDASCSGSSVLKFQKVALPQ